MFNCQYCNKEFETKTQLGGHVSHCKLNPNYEKNLEKLKYARSFINYNKSKEHKHLHCKFCDKEVANEGCLTLHETQCPNNPNRIYRNPNKNRIYKPNPNVISWNKGLTKETNESVLKISNTLKENYANGTYISVWKGKHLSEEHKQKIHEGLQKWKENHREEFLQYSRSKSKCCENFKQYLKNNNIDFIEEYCPYPNERLYSLDIAWPDEKIAIEINGSQHYDDKGNLNQYTLDKQKFFEDHGWKIIQIYYKWCYGIIRKNKEINSIFDLPIHNKNYVKEIYKRSYQAKQKKQIQDKIEKYNRQETNKQKQQIEENRKQIIYNLINNSGIDFSKSGWSTQATKYLQERGELWNKIIFRCIRKYYPEFLQREDVYKRKGSKY